MSAVSKPGDVAIIAIKGGDRLVIGLRDTHGWAHLREYDSEVVSHSVWTNASQVTVVWPLVVIDPDDVKQVARLVDAVLANGYKYDGSLSADMAAALRSLIEPPKPDEPTGLGAVVLGSDGNLWVAGPGVPGGKRWEPEDGGESRYYRDVPAISEMSVGVEPMADWERDLLREVER